MKWIQIIDALLHSDLSLAFTSYGKWSWEYFLSSMGMLKETLTEFIIFFTKIKQKKTLEKILN
jgi:hypothetical protein